MTSTNSPPAPRISTVSLILAELAFFAGQLDETGDLSSEDAAEFRRIEDRFVFEPVRFSTDAIVKLEYLAGDDDLDPIHEDLIRSVIAFLRSQVTG